MSIQITNKSVVTALTLVACFFMFSTSAMAQSNNRGHRNHQNNRVKTVKTVKRGNTVRKTTTVNRGRQAKTTRTTEQRRSDVARLINQSIA